jgi:GH24 family phage-related lysozyme (muramidase)
VLAVNSLIIPWEGLVLHSHWDRYAKIYDICYGETRIDGKPVKPGMTKTKDECRDMLIERVVADYYKPLTRCIENYTALPVSLQASLLSGAYNFGVGAACKSRAAQFAREDKYLQACEAQTAFNKAGGEVLPVLVKRREMGDAQRIGEAELCVSGLEGTK